MSRNDAAVVLAYIALAVLLFVSAFFAFDAPLAFIAGVVLTGLSLATALMVRRDSRMP